MSMRSALTATSAGSGVGCARACMSCASSASSGASPGSAGCGYGLPSVNPAKKWEGWGKKRNGLEKVYAGKVNDIEIPCDQLRGQFVHMICGKESVHG